MSFMVTTLELGGRAPPPNASSSAKGHSLSSPNSITCIRKEQQHHREY